MTKLPKDIEDLLVYQKIVKAPTEEGLKQLVLGICVFVRQCRNANVEVNGDFVQINLIKFKGLKDVYHRAFNKYELSEFQIEAITKLVHFWLSFIEKPLLNISWK